MDKTELKKIIDAHLKAVEIFRETQMKATQACVDYMKEKNISKVRTVLMIGACPSSATKGSFSVAQLKRFLELIEKNGDILYKQPRGRNRDNMHV